MEEEKEGTGSRVLNACIQREIEEIQSMLYLFPVMVFLVFLFSTFLHMRIETHTFLYGTSNRAIFFFLPFFFFGSVFVRDVFCEYGIKTTR